MLDRVREAMFSTLGPWIDGAQVLDLFAGTGSLGLEALSRGARHARLVESGRGMVRSLRESVDELGLEQRCTLCDLDALDEGSWDAELSGDARYDIVFFDPPYPMLARLDTRRRLLEALEKLVGGRLAEEGVVVFHAPRGRLRGEDLDHIGVHRLREYGSNALWYLQASGGDDA